MIHKIEKVYIYMFSLQEIHDVVEVETVCYWKLFQVHQQQENL